MEPTKATTASIRQVARLLDVASSASDTDVVTITLGSSHPWADPKDEYLIQLDYLDALVLRDQLVKLLGS